MNIGNRVAIYGRTSSYDGRQEVENQLGELRRLTAVQGEGEFAVDFGVD